MNDSEIQLRALTDPRLAAHATSALPVWLWSTDGTRILWANPVGASLFGAAKCAGLAGKVFGPADPHRRQVAQLAGSLPPDGAIRLERLRGFGAALGTRATCRCTRMDFSDGSRGILIVAQTVARGMPLLERLQRLVECIDRPIAAFARDGMFVGASEAARPLLDFRNLGELGLDGARNDALTQGRVETAIRIGHMVLQRVGHGADVGLVALIEPGAMPAPPPQPVAPAGFELIGALSEECAPAPGDGPALHLASEAEEPMPQTRPHPLRFTWQIDADGCFSLAAGEFTDLIGPRTAASLGRPWGEIAETFGLDPEGRIARAIAGHDTWSGISVNWPLDGGDWLPVELSGLPMFDHARNHAGYRGFGVCRDLEKLTRLAARRRSEPPRPQTPSADGVKFDSPPDLPAENSPPRHDLTSPVPSRLPARVAVETSSPTDWEEPVETPPNVVPFRPIGEPKSPTLTPVENNAFDELGRQLSLRLEGDDGPLTEPPPNPKPPEPAIESAAGETRAADIRVGEMSAEPQGDPPATTHGANAKPDWLAPPEPPARGETQRDRMLLDLLPTGILIYRLDRLLYANPAFLGRIGYASLHALEQAGGLDALYVEPGVSPVSTTSEAGTPVTISANQAGDGGASSVPTDARLIAISWDGDSALALICGPSPAAPVTNAVTMATPAVGRAEAEDLAAIIDTTAEGIVMFDARGKIHACNRSAEALFGYDGTEFVRHDLSELFAPESQREVQDYLAGITGAKVASLLDHGREVLGRERNGGLIPLSVTMGRTRPDGPNFFAVFREFSPSKKLESHPREPRRLSDGAANAKADMLSRISHEVRTPLNAIIGFAEVMIGERFGALGNERYVEYMKDIRASGERVIAIINDLLELSRIETGKLDLTFANQNLNDLVESCVGLMQPQANRERIIIRTSLAHALPPVVADARALRQIALNLIGNSIHLANAGGQVIVSTALSDRGEVVLRVRDTGPGLNDNEVAAALEPFRTPPASDRGSESSGVSLSLTKALVEANRAQFYIKPRARSGTLIEVVFSYALTQA